MIQTCIGKSVLRENLTREASRECMEQVLNGEATAAQIAGLAIALRMKGETPEEIAGMAEAMRRRVPPLPPSPAGRAAPPATARAPC